MMHIFGMNGVMPLIVAGPQRCGTRFVTKLLNSHPSVHIDGEIQLPLIESALTLLEFSTKYYRGRRTEKEYSHWVEKRPELLACLWHLLGKEKIKNIPESIKYFGYKTPFHERYFYKYQEYLNDRKLLCVYCIRSFRDHYLSVKARWPDRSIRQTARRYLESLETFCHIERNTPDQIFPFVIELSGLYGVDYIKKALIEPLGLEMTQEFAAGIDPNRKENSAEKLGKVRLSGLSKREARYVEKHPRLESEYQAIRERHIQMMSGT